MTEIEKRRRELAKRIGVAYCATDNLIPLSQDPIRSMTAYSGGIWYMARACDIAWFAVAKRLRQISGNENIIDHEWSFGFGSEPYEPWGFVTEPYASRDRAEAVVDKANEIMSDWTVRFHLLEASASSWNPGACLPIVAVIDGGVAPFMRNALTWVLDDIAA